MAIAKNISKQQEARKEQKYISDPDLTVCENCAYYRSIFVENQWGGHDEKLRRCSLGNFAVKRKSTCARHTFKQPDEEKVGNV